MFAEPVRNRDELACDGSDDNLVWLSRGSQAVSEGFQDRVVMAGDEVRVEHDVSQLAPSSSNGALAAHGTAVMCDWGQSRERGGLLTGELAEFGHLGDQHSAGAGADLGNGTQDIGNRSQVIIRGYCLLDPNVQLCNLAIEKAFQLGIHGNQHIRRPQLAVL